MDEPEYKATYEQESGVTPAVMNVCGAPPAHHPNSSEFRKEMALKTPAELFNLSLNNITSAIKEELDRTPKNKAIFKDVVTDTGRCNMCKTVKRLASPPYNVNVEYLNPLAFVLGYLAVVNKVIVDPAIDLRNPDAESKTKIKRFNETIRPLTGFVNSFADILGFGTLTDLDILRYGRFMYETRNAVANDGCAAVR